MAIDEADEASEGPGHRPYSAGRRRARARAAADAPATATGSTGDVPSPVAGVVVAAPSVEAVARPIRTSRSWPPLPSIARRGSPWRTEQGVPATGLCGFPLDGDGLEKPWARTPPSALRGLPVGRTRPR
jgi:hypothetical protein